MQVRGEPPRPRDSHAAAALGEKLVVFGGDCQDSYVSDVHVLDTRSLRWKEIKCTSEVRHIMMFFGFECSNSLLKQRVPLMSHRLNRRHAQAMR